MRPVRARFRLATRVRSNPSWHVTFVGGLGFACAPRGGIAMDDDRFDAFSRIWGTGTSRRGALGALAGLAGLGLEAAAARGRHGKKRHATGRQSGKRHARAAAGKGAGGNSACAAWCHQLFGDTADAGRCTSDAAHGKGLCQQCGAADPQSLCCVRNSAGLCTDYASTGCPCPSGQTCDSSGQCQSATPDICSGKPASTPCFPFSSAACGTSSNRTCHCGVDLQGNAACYDLGYCNNAPLPECTSNADCEATFGPRSICFNGDGCCLSKTGCTTPCASPSA